MLQSLTTRAGVVVSAPGNSPEVLSPRTMRPKNRWLTTPCSDCPCSDCAAVRADKYCLLHTPCIDCVAVRADRFCILRTPRIDDRADICRSLNRQRRISGYAGSENGAGDVEPLLSAPLTAWWRVAAATVGIAPGSPDARKCPRMAAAAAARPQVSTSVSHFLTRKVGNYLSTKSCSLRLPPPSCLPFACCSSILPAE